MRSHHHSARGLGFTLIELIVTIAVIAILASVSIPSYRNYIQSSRRADAVKALSAAAVLQEKYRINNSSYGTAVQALIPNLSDAGYYNISVTSYSSSAYTIQASAPTTSPQYSDSGCNTITLDQAGTFAPVSCIKR